MRIAWLMSSLLLLAMAPGMARAAGAGCPKDLFAHPDLQKSRASFKDYEVRIFEADACGEEPGTQRAGFQILEGGKPLYTRTGYSFSVGYPYADDQSPDAFPVPIGTDITGEGEPDLLISEYSGGAHCCFTFHLFRIGKAFGKIQSLPLFDADESDFIHRQGQKGLLLDTVDYSAFAGFPFGFAGSPAGRVLLSFQKGQFRLDLKRMKANPPTQVEFDNCWKRLRASADWKKNDEPQPMGLWYYATDLVYTGNGAIAWNFIYQAWGGGRDGYQRYFAEYRARLAKSVYYPQLEALQKAPLTAQGQKVDWEQQCRQYAQP